jgi:hypothetical protein
MLAISGLIILWGGFGGFGGFDWISDSVIGINWNNTEIASLEHIIQRKIDYIECLENEINHLNIDIKFLSEKLIIQENIKTNLEIENIYLIEQNRMLFECANLGYNFNEN